MPERPCDTLIDPGLAAGYRIMAEAGVLLEEFELKKQIDARKMRLAELTGECERRNAIIKLARLETRLGIAIDARKKFHQG